MTELRAMLMLSSHKKVTLAVGTLKFFTYLYTITLNNLDMIEYSIEPAKVILSDEQIATIQEFNNKLNGDEEHDHYVMLALMQNLEVYGDDVMHLYEYLVEADADMRSEYDNDIDGFYEDQIPNQLATIDEAVVVLEKMLGYPEVSGWEYDGPEWTVINFGDDDDDE